MCESLVDVAVIFKIGFLFGFLKLDDFIGFQFLIFFG